MLKVTYCIYTKVVHFLLHGPFYLKETSFNSRTTVICNEYKSNVQAVIFNKHNTWELQLKIDSNSDIKAENT